MRWSVPLSALSTAAVPFGALAACRNPTEVTVVLTTDTCDAGYSATAISVTTANARVDAAATVTTQCAADGSIGTLVVVPGSSGEGPFVVTVHTAVSGASGAGDPLAACAAQPKACVVAQREIGFIDHTPLTLPIEMRRVCEGITCEPGFTCVEGACVGASVIGSTCLAPAGCDKDKGDQPGASRLDASLGDATSVTSANCNGGTCTTLATGQQPWDIALDATHVYWTDRRRGTITKVAKGGGTPTTLETNQSPWGIAIDSDSVYWTVFGPGSGVVRKCPLDGGAPIELSAEANIGTSIAVSNSAVAWATAQGVSYDSTGAPGSSMLASLPPTLPSYALALHSTGIYWGSIVPDAGLFQAKIMASGVTTSNQPLVPNATVAALALEGHPLLGG